MGAGRQPTLGGLVPTPTPHPSAGRPVRGRAPTCLPGSGGRVQVPCLTKPGRPCHPPTSWASGPLPRGHGLPARVAHSLPTRPRAGAAQGGGPRQSAHSSVPRHHPGAHVWDPRTEGGWTGRVRCPCWAAFPDGGRAAASPTTPTILPTSLNSRVQRVLRLHLSCAVRAGIGRRQPSRAEEGGTPATVLTAPTTQAGLRPPRAPAPAIPPARVRDGVLGPQGPVCIQRRSHTRPGRTQLLLLLP